MDTYTHDSSSKECEAIHCMQPRAAECIQQLTLHGKGRQLTQSRREGGIEKIWFWFQTKAIQVKAHLFIKTGTEGPQLSPKQLELSMVGDQAITRLFRVQVSIPQSCWRFIVLWISLERDKNSSERVQKFSSMPRSSHTVPTSYRTVCSSSGHLPTSSQRTIGSCRVVSRSSRSDGCTCTHLFCSVWCKRPARMTSWDLGHS